MHTTVINLLDQKLIYSLLTESIQHIEFWTLAGDRIGVNNYFT